MFIAAAVISIFIIFCFLDIITSPKYPSGPTRVPLLGNYLEIRKLKNKLGFYHLVWDKLAKCYGQVFSVKFGPMEAIVVSGYDAVRQVLCKDDFDGQANGFFFRTKAFYKRLGIAFVDGPMWTAQRKFCMQHLRKLGLDGNAMEKIIIEEVNDFVLDITRRYESGKSIEVYGLFEVSVLNGLWAMLAGDRFSLDDSRLARIVELVHESLRMLDMPGGILNQLPFIRYLAPKFSGKKYLKQIINELYILLKESAEEHKCKENDQKDFINAFLMEIKKNKESLGSFSEEQLVVILLDLFLAGSETTSITLSSVILHLSKNQDVQTKVHAELDLVIGDREIYPSDKKKLNYLEAVLMEVQRHSNVVPLAIATKRTIQKTRLQKYIIPKDTLVMASIWSVHMDEQHWGDPEVFRPERFLDSTGKIIDDSWFMPFGVGRRRCLGENLAKMYIFTFIAKLIQNFEILIPHEVQLPDKPQNDIKMSQSPVFAFFIPRRCLKLTKLPTMNGPSPNLFHSKNFEICRICMRKPESDPNVVYTNIFGSTIKGFQLKDLILKCLGVEVNKDDNKPKIICIKCLKKVRKWTRIKRKADKSQHAIDCIATKKLEQLTEDKMEIDCDNMSSDAVEKSKTFDDSDIDGKSYNANEIKFNEEKSGNQLAQYSQNSTEGNVEIELNKSQTTIYQRPLITRLKPCPLVIPLNNNQRTSLPDFKSVQYRQF
ncbi:methyl farnesoate epoxidase-like [Myzus persicae]|uniref:methyl farnesoate epoxidase-like n=1 Tax=Myzus persicae TaxID=13164 RepID=UPI000B9303FC|nr:methyl farnesoate epoxidase-like [Myzus persicae]